MSHPTDTLHSMKPWRCPHCGDRTGVPVLYGLPSAAAVEAARRGSLVLGGCVLTDDDPPRCCTACRAALWPGAVFAVPGAADDPRITIVFGRRRRLEARAARDGYLVLEWRGARPGELPMRVEISPTEVARLFVASDLAGRGRHLMAWFERRGLPFVGEMKGPVGRITVTEDECLVISGPGGDLLVHASLERVLLQLVRTVFLREGYRSICEFRQWLTNWSLGTGPVDRPWLSER